MHKLKVGELYNAGHTTWPECAQFSCSGGGWELVLFLATPSGSEIGAARTGRAEFALLVRGPVLFFLYRFGAPGSGIPWSDAPTTIHLIAESDRKLPPAPTTPEQRAVLQLMLVDAATGILRALRQLSLSHEMTEALYGATIAQAAQPWDQAGYERTVQAAYTEFPNSVEMATAAPVRCVGGA